MKNPMTISPEGLEWLKTTERLAVTPYDDQTGRSISDWVQGATIGYGHLIARAQWPTYAKGISAEAAETLLDEDLKPFLRAVNEIVTVALAPHQFDALTILVYNIGISAFSRSSVVKLVNDPSARVGYASLEDAWKAWNKSQGNVMAGLVKRRAAEWTMYESGRYTHW